LAEIHRQNDGRDIEINERFQANLMNDIPVPEAVFRALNRPRIAGESDSDFVIRVSREIGMDDPAALSMIALMLHFTHSMGKIPGKIQAASDQVLNDSRAALEAEGVQIVRKTAGDLAKDLRASVGQAAVHEARRMEITAMTRMIAFLCVFTSITFTLGYLLGANRANAAPPFTPAWWTGTNIFDRLLRAPVGWVGLWLAVTASGVNILFRLWTKKNASPFSDEVREIGLENWVYLVISIALLMFFNWVS
jgi:hypothetical protein